MECCLDLLLDFVDVFDVFAEHHWIIHLLFVDVLIFFLCNFNCEIFETVGSG
jgi:hypothetical protein